MKLTLTHLYPEAMSLYGEYANLSLLSRLLEELGAEVTIEKVLFDDEPDFTHSDLIYMGAGTEGMQKAALTRLQLYTNDLRSAVGRGALILFTGNAMETLGASVTDREGKVWQGLGLAGFTTVETDKRTPHDAIARTALWEAPVVGFMNKCSTTTGVETPLFHKMDLGFGNDAQGGAEGYAKDNILATHLTGPVLVKNPAFLWHVVHRLFAAAGAQVPQDFAAPLWLEHASQGYNVTYAELSQRR